MQIFCSLINIRHECLYNKPSLSLSCVGGDELANLLEAERLYSEGLDKYYNKKLSSTRDEIRQYYMLPTVSERRFFLPCIFFAVVLR